MHRRPRFASSTVTLAAVALPGGGLACAQVSGISGQRVVLDRDVVLRPRRNLVLPRVDGPVLGSIDGHYY